MSFSYQPLASDEIRLIKIEPAENGDDSQPILCTIEHVNLLPGVTVSPDRRFKGQSDVWPEISDHHDTDALFDKGRDPFVVSQGPSPSLDEEARLPWRYPWGDFIALSYEWGPPTPRRFITVNGAQFGVTPNLYDALIQLRRTQRIRQGFRLWIDAICINQDNLVERGQQVAHMRDIYRSAWQVVIWIGPEADDSSLALSALHWLADQSRRPTPLEGVYRQGMAIDARPFFVVIPGYESPLRRAVYKALFCFFTRTYWRRMWIIQEVANGRPGAPVLCGNRCIAWDDIYRAAVVINNDQARLGRDILDSSRPPLAALNTYEFARDRLAEDTHLSSERLWGMQVALGGIQLNQKLSSLGDWQALTLVLNLCRDSNVTEEKDRVYGILGINAVAERVAVVPDYTLSLSALYLSFTSKFLEAGDLNILRLISRPAGPIPIRRRLETLPSALQHRTIAPAIFRSLDLVKGSKPDQALVGTPCTHDLPSWTVCWTCAPPPTIHLGGSYQTDCGLGPASPIYPSLDSSITVKGIILDTITCLGASHSDEVDEAYPSNIAPSDHSIYGDFKATQEALWRTIVADTKSQGGCRAPEAYSWLLDRNLWSADMDGVYTHGFGFRRFMTRNKRLSLCGYNLEQLIFGPKQRFTMMKRARGALGYQVCFATEIQRESFSWAINVMAWRRLFGTRDGRMGLGASAAKVGDSIAILQGCNTPMILRRLREGWVIVGECYVHGIMYGEVIQGEHKVADIKIY
ncbi:hypothetical protein LCI18_006813 [Fusarium solani-melongenae]|uniref:Uncharacterized protein n=1 Tax=Fusarium solani subsp. cucurbitae TaxID=2747967 RepID=A0ACD3Z484_FUSSC|nr:hypothetical protein LCI18_006813 [Fusarium solani-melongenae]